MRRVISSALGVVVLALLLLGFVVWSLMQHGQATLAATISIGGGLAASEAGSCSTGGAPAPAGGGGSPGGSVGAFNARQVANAKTIIAVGKGLNVPAKGWVIALATAMQESKLRDDLDEAHSDRDSAGLFQQRRPWGPLAERMDPTGSARRFYTGGDGGQRGLLDISGWENLPVTVAAQRVQVSAFPSAYAQWEDDARQLVALYGGTTVAVAVTDPTDQAGQVDCYGPVAGEASGDCPAPAGTKNFQNGRIPASALCALATSKGKMLRSDAAASFDRMSTAYKVVFGTFICVTGAYRDYATQVRLRAEKPGLAAVPGTSNHGWGIATDLCGGIQSFSTPQHNWLASNAPRFGWVHPSWARSSGSKPEPWHFEYNPAES